MPQHILVDLFCGRGGWSHAASARGWRCIGFDNVNHGYPYDFREQTLPIPAQDIRSLNPSLVVASPPCEEFARRHLPWMQMQGPLDLRLLRWAIGLEHMLDCPVVVECSHFAAREQPGGACRRPWHLWGSLPALLPDLAPRKTRITGESPARRAEIPETLADWIVQCAERRHGG